MESILTDHKEKVLKNLERVRFEVKNKGIYLIQISAKTKDEKQLSSTDDEDLKIEIDNRKFPLLSNQQRYFDSPAAFSGGATHGLTKVVFFILWLDTGFHHINLIPDISAAVVSIDVWQLDESSTLNELDLSLKLIAEDGDRRDWLTFALVDANLKSFTPELVLKRRFLDSDDVKITIDDSIEEAHYNNCQKFWYFIASLIKGEKQSKEFKDVDNDGKLELLAYYNFLKDPTRTVEVYKYDGDSFSLIQRYEEVMPHTYL